MKTIWILLIALSSTMLGLERFGATSIAPGPDLGFSWKTRSSSEENWIEIGSDAGTLACWVKVDLEADWLNAQSVKAQVAGQEVLAKVRQVGGHRWSVEISAFGKAEESHAVFSWPTGDRILLNVRSGYPIKVVDWEVHLKDQERDSAAKARRRQLWTWCSAIFLLLSIVGIVLDRRPDSEANLLTPHSVLTGLVKSIDLDNRGDTRDVRHVLMKVVVEGVTVREALESVKGDWPRRWGLWFKARAQLRSRLSFLVSRLNEALEGLSDGPK